MQIDQYSTEIMEKIHSLSQYINTHQRKLSTIFSSKSDGSLVTLGDIYVSQQLTSYLRDITPGIPVYCEEYDPLFHISHKQYYDSNQITWVLDPIDGTKSFSNGEKYYGIMLSLLKNKIPIAGWISCPALGLSAFGCVGCGVQIIGGSKRHLIERPIKCLKAVIASGDFDLNHYNSASIFSKQLHKTYKTKSCAVDYLYYLTGKVDILLYRRSFPWDHAAGVLLSNEIGACVSNFDGDSIAFNSSNEGIFICDTKVIKDKCSSLLPSNIY